MKVTNRSDGTVTYSLEEFRVRRVFAVNETKDINPAELEALYQTDGGQVLIQDYLILHDKEWVENHFEPAIEYFWGEAEIQKCLEEDPLELFAETIDFAPVGVIEIIKKMSWQLPLTDLNKVNVIKEKLGFDPQLAVQLMSNNGNQAEKPVQKERLRKER